jgi:hypothetical protein
VKTIQQFRRYRFRGFIHLITCQATHTVDGHLRNQSQLLIERISGLKEYQPDDVLRDQYIALHNEE